MTPQRPQTPSLLLCNCACMKTIVVRFLCSVNVGPPSELPVKQVAITDSHLEEGMIVTVGMSHREYAMPATVLLEWSSSGKASAGNN